MYYHQPHRSLGSPLSSLRSSASLSGPHGLAFKTLLVTLVCFLAARQESLGANGTWTGLQTGTQAWSDGTNWTGGIIPGALTGTTNADVATFGTTTAGTLVTIDAGRTLRTLTFSGTNAAGLYTIGSLGANLGEALHLTSGGNITNTLGMTTTTTINAPLILEAASSTTAGTYTFASNATTGSADLNPYKLNFNGDISGGTTSSTITLNLTGTAGNRSAADTSSNTITGLISNGGAAGGLSLNVTGSAGGQQGVWKLSNNGNSFTGGVVVTNGTLFFTSLANAGVPSSIGAGNALTVGGGSHVKYQGGATSTDRTITGGGSFYNAGSGAITLTGNVLLPGVLTFRGSQNFIIDGLISGASGLSRTDGGTVFLNNNANSFLGNVSISDGAFRFATIADKNTVSSLGKGTQISLGQDSITVGRLEYTGASGGSSTRDIVMSNGASATSGNGRIDNTVAGQTLTLSGTVKSFSSNASHVSSLNLTGVGNGVLSGIIGGTTADAAATIALELSKTGTGTWAIAGANNYSRGTLISAGTLLATNTSGSATGTGSVITSGTGTLGGTGIISGSDGKAITIATGTKLMVGNTHQVASGVTGNAGYVAGVSNLRLGTNANVAITLAGTLQFDLFTNAGAATLGQADLLTLNTTATSITLGGVIAVVDSTPIHSPWTSGQWQLIDWTGVGAATKNGVFTFDFTNAGALPSGYTWATSTFLDDGMISIAKTALNQTWIGGTSGSWATASNWESNTLPSASTDVFFNGLAVGNLTQTIDDNKTVRNLYFSGEKNFVINTGTGGVLYSAGTLFDVAGGTQRLGAQLRITAGNIPAYTINNNGTLTFDTSIMYHRQGTVTTTAMDLIFSGTGTTSVNHFQRRSNVYDLNIVKNGSGTLTLTGFTNVAALLDGAGFITGTTTVNAGKLRLNNEGNLGGDPAVFNAAQLNINGGTVAAYADFTLDDANRGITFGPNGGTLEVETNRVLTVQVPITGTGSFTKAGDGRLTLSGVNTQSGSTTVAAGILEVGSTGFTGTGSTSVSSGAQLVGTGTVQASSFSLQAGATLQAGNITSGTTTGNGTLTFTPTGVGSYHFQTDSTLLLSLSSASNQSAIDPTFGGNAVGTPGYAAYVAGITAVGDHDHLTFNGAAGSTLTFNGKINLITTGFTPALGQIFNLLDWATLVATDFSGFAVGQNRDGSGDNSSQFNLPDISGSGFIWDVSQFTTTGNLVVVLVPEPSRALLLLLGFVAVMGRRRRK